MHDADNGRAGPRRRPIRCVEWPDRDPILAPYLASPWVPMSPDVADLSTRLDRLDENLRDLGHGAKGVAAAWGRDA